jgi:hypothetical protein
MPVPLIDGYDMGGAYWGIGQTLWAIVDQDGDSTFHRANDQNEAFELADISPEYRENTLNTELSREYLSALIYRNAVEITDWEEWDDSAEMQAAVKLAESLIDDEKSCTISQIESIAEMY